MAGTGSARGSLRRGQWSAPLHGDRPGGADGDAGNGDSTGTGTSTGSGTGTGSGSSAAGPADGRTGRTAPTAAILVAVSVLVIGLGATLAVKAHGSGGTSGQASPTDLAASSPVASKQAVRGNLPSATVTSPKASPKQTTAVAAAPAGPQVTQTPSPGTPTPQATPAVPGPLGYWPLNPVSLGVDRTNAHPVTNSNVTAGTGHGGSGVFDGKDSQLSTAGPVVDTAPGASFTVSAWVYLTSADAYATAVSQDGSSFSEFFLQYSKDANRWDFVRPNSPQAVSTAEAALNTWTHLVGVYDGNGDQMTLYVDGVFQSATHASAPTASTGGLVIGRGKWGGTDCEWFPGQINDVEVFGQALSAAQVRML
jgi:hypothetical protein